MSGPAAALNPPRSHVEQESEELSEELTNLLTRLVEGPDECDLTVADLKLLHGRGRLRSAFHIVVDAKSGRYASMKDIVEDAIEGYTSPDAIIPKRLRRLIIYTPTKQVYASTVEDYELLVCFRKSKFDGPLPVALVRVGTVQELAGALHWPQDLDPAAQATSAQKLDSVVASISTLAGLCASWDEAGTAVRSQLGANNMNRTLGKMVATAEKAAKRFLSRGEPEDVDFYENVIREFSNLETVRRKAVRSPVAFRHGPLPPALEPTIVPLGRGSTPQRTTPSARC